MSCVCCATDLGYFTHVTRDHPFQDSGLFYRFTEDEKTGGVAADGTGQKVSASAFIVDSCSKFPPTATLQHQHQQVI